MVPMMLAKLEETIERGGESAGQSALSAGVDAARVEVVECKPYQIGRSCWFRPDCGE